MNNPTVKILEVKCEQYCSRKHFDCSNAREAARQHTAHQQRDEAFASATEGPQPHGTPTAAWTDLALVYHNHWGTLDCSVADTGSSVPLAEEARRLRPRGIWLNAAVLMLEGVPPAPSWRISR